MFARHARAAEATRRCVRSLGPRYLVRGTGRLLELDDRGRAPRGHSADALRRTILEKTYVSLGNGLGRLADTVFRIGHMGDFNDASILGVWARSKSACRCPRSRLRSGGVGQAIAYFADPKASLPAAAE